ncbi:dCTP deaminase domain-containing protein [Micromonospora haikouensis]|uniref:dCTP deaminase n=1 Tax=Micromonospora haikouensis TaxID=686309 RepID=UPI0037912ACA
MVLTAGEITRLIEADEVGWPGKLRGDGLLLCLGAPVQLLVATAPGAIVDLADQASINQLYQPPRKRWDSCEIPPGGMALCQVDQPLRLGPGQAGAIGTLSHLARVGLATHVTSPWVLPGWNGHLTLELHNVSPATLRIRCGMPVARLVLFNMDGSITHASAHPFYGGGGHLGSRYADEFPAHDYQG